MSRHLTACALLVGVRCGLSSSPDWFNEQVADVVVPTVAEPQLRGLVIPQDFADSFGAKCLDGTPPAFYYVRTRASMVKIPRFIGSSPHPRLVYQLVQDVTRWVIFIEGGGWCFSLSDCAGRAKGGGGACAVFRGGGWGGLRHAFALRRIPRPSPAPCRKQ